MPTRSPKDTEEKMERMLNAWRELAPGKSFGGRKLAQFETIAAPAQAARQRLDDLDDQRTQAIAERDRADEEFM
jgi:cell division protein FtsB